MRELTQEEIQILQRHAKWLADEAGGEKADLRGANLRGANLRGADLRGANLRGAKNILAFGPIGSRLDITYAVKYRDRIMIKCGCFWGDLEQWQAQCRAIHGDNSHAAAYAAAADFIRAYAAAYWQD